MNMNQKIAELPSPDHPLSALARRLCELLDEDKWAECEALLLKAWEPISKVHGADVGNLRKAPPKAHPKAHPKVPTRKNLKLELRVKGLELTVKVLEQDDVDTCKDDEADGMDFEASNGLILKSAYAVAIYSENELFIKGYGPGDIYKREFTSETELKDYLIRLKQAVKEFNAAGGFAKTTEETVEIVE